MRVTIIGAGAIGGVTGAFMARAGEDVTLVDAVVEHIQAIRDDGLRMDGLHEFTVQVPAITPDERGFSLRTVTPDLPSSACGRIQGRPSVQLWTPDPAVLKMTGFLRGYSSRPGSQSHGVAQGTLMQSLACVIGQAGLFHATQTLEEPGLNNRSR